jgi:serine/threonine protein kinase
LIAGACLGPYRIEGKLGKGGMGDVFRAVDTRLGRAIAIKTTQQRFSARFEREARAIASLNHVNICQIYDVGANYLVMELVEGPTLADICRYTTWICASRFLRFWNLRFAVPRRRGPEHASVVGWRRKD